VPDDVKRAYRSSVRDAQAAATRAALREAAARLFVDQGYVATSIRQVAQAAGVAERTVYLAFPSKAALFQHTLNVAIVGDEGQRSVGDRMADEVLTLQDPHAVLAVTLDQAADLLDRAGDLIMVSVEAAGSDPDMRAAAEAGSRATHAHYLALTEHLDRLGALAPGMTPSAAADVLYALGSPHLHHLLRRNRRWSKRAYREWLHSTLSAQLLG
jgi:AcrR family transcriptional regulator